MGRSGIGRDLRVFMLANELLLRSGNLGGTARIGHATGAAAAELELVVE